MEQIKKIDRWLAAHLNRSLPDTMFVLATIAWLSYAALILYGHSPVDTADELGIYLGGIDAGPWAGVASFDWSPLYTSWYFFLSRLNPNSAATLLASHAVLPPLLLASWGILLLRLGWGTALSCATVIALSLNPEIWFTHNKVNHFSLLLLTLFATGILCVKDRAQALLLAMPLATVLVCARMEMFLLLPILAVLFAFFVPRNRARRPMMTCLFWGAFAGSLLLLAWAGFFANQKSSDLFALGDINRFAIGHRAPPAADPDRALLDRVRAGIAIVVEKPAELTAHLAHNARQSFEQTGRFFRKFFGHAGNAFYLFAFFPAIGLIALLFDRENREPNAALTGKTLLVFFLFALPPLTACLIYFSVPRYLIAVFFSLFSLTCLPVFFLGEANRRIVSAGVLCLAIAMQPSWAAKMRSKNSLSRYYPSISEQMRAITHNGGDHYLTSGCGAIWNVVGIGASKGSQAFQYIYDVDRQTFTTPLPELIAQKNVVVFCENRIAEYAAGVRALVEYLQFEQERDFEGLELSPSGIRIYIRKHLIVRPLPNGVRPIETGNFRGQS